MEDRGQLENFEADILKHLTKLSSAAGLPSHIGHQAHADYQLGRKGVAQTNDRVVKIVQGQHQFSAGTENSGQLGQSDAKFVEMIEVVKGRRRDDEFEGIVWKRQGANVGDRTVELWMLFVGIVEVIWLEAV